MLKHTLILLLLLAGLADIAAQNTSRYLLRRSAEGHDMYHIKTQKFNSPGKVKAVADITVVLEKGNNNISTTINYTLKSAGIKGTPINFALVSGNDTLSADEIKLMYIERTGNWWKTRTGISYTSPESIQLLTRDITFILTYPDRTIKLVPVKSAAKRIRLAAEIILLESAPQD